MAFWYSYSVETKIQIQVSIRRRGFSNNPGSQKELLESFSLGARTNKKWQNGRKKVDTIFQRLQFRPK